MNMPVTSFRRITVLALAPAALMCTTGMTCIVTPPHGSARQAQLVFQGLNAAVLSVSGTSADDVYAVGADPGDGSGPYLLHYNGATWRRIANALAGELWWISVEPVGGDFFLAGSNGKIVRFTPATDGLQPFATPGDETIFGVWMADANNAWAVGGDTDNPDTSGVIWYFDGNTWTEVDTTSIAAGGIPVLYKVWGRGVGDVYAVGRLGYVLHFDGDNWTRLTTNTTRTLFTVHGNATTLAAVGGFADAVILEPGVTGFADVAMFGTPQMNGVFIPSTALPDGHTGVAVGVDATVLLRGSAESDAGKAQRSDPRTLHAVDGWEIADVGLDAVGDFHAVWVDPDGGIWAVGGDLSVNLSDGIVAFIGERTISSTVTP